MEFSTIEWIVIGFIGFIVSLSSFQKIYFKYKTYKRNVTRFKTHIDTVETFDFNFDDMNAASEKSLGELREKAHQSALGDMDQLTR